MSNKSKSYKEPAESERVPASSLHKHVEEVRHELEEEHEREIRQHEESERHAYFEFLNRQFTEADRRHVQELTRKAVHKGEFEVEILRFPASYLSDGGRAINNNEKDWPASLTGYAKSTYDAFADIAAPLGYRLVARILDYPHGMIGNIAFFLEW